MGNRTNIFSLLFRDEAYKKIDSLYLNDGALDLNRILSIYMGELLSINDVKISCPVIIANGIEKMREGGVAVANFGGIFLYKRGCMSPTANAVFGCLFLNIRLLLSGGVTGMVIN